MLLKGFNEVVWYLAHSKFYINGSFCYSLFEQILAGRLMFTSCSTKSPGMYSTRSEVLSVPQEFSLLQDSNRDARWLERQE